MSMIKSERMIDALRAAGLVTEDGKDLVTRVVIDLRVGHAPVIHIQRLCDERLLRLVPGFNGVEITREEAP